MLYLLLSILSASSLIVIIRLFDKWNVKSEHGIVFNYIFCVITGLFFIDDFSVFKQFPSWNGLPFVIALGFAFMLIFILVGKTTEISGVVTASIAMKLSFAIPVVLAVFLYGDSVTLLKIIGVLCAFTAVYLIAYEKESSAVSANVIDERITIKKTSKTVKLIYPFLIFIGCGLCDSTFNYIQKKLMPPGWDHPVTIVVFVSASFLGIILNFYKKELYQWKNVVAGIALGVPNYFSLYFLLKTLNTLTWQSSVIFPINNLGVVCVSAFAGFVMFKEKFNQRKLIGFILAIASIVIIGFLD